MSGEHSRGDALTSGRLQVTTGVATQSLNYTDALALVMGLTDFEQRPEGHEFHLERMALLLSRLGDPHLAIHTVHVAGTKGKGSVSAMVASVLKAAGCTTGLYTSPHVHTARERIQVNGNLVSATEFAALVEVAWPLVEWVSQYGGYGSVTTFETLTLLAFLHFRNVKAKYQVLEVGIGGRLDSTNVVHPDVAVITSISLDHVEILGNSIGAIAHEKSGIIKPNSTVVTAPQVPEAIEVIRDTAKDRNARLIEVAQHYNWEGGEMDLEGQTLNVKGPNKAYHFRVPLLGDYQMENAVTALAAVEMLRYDGHDIPDAAIAEGIHSLRWPARMEVLSTTGPIVLVDGAHNVDSSSRLKSGVQRIHDVLGKNCSGRVILLFGALAGHDFRGILEQLAELDPEVMVVRPRHPRSLPTKRLAKTAREIGLEIVGELDGVAESTQKAMKMANKNDMILGTGSLMVASEVRAEILGVDQETYPSLGWDVSARE